VRRQVILIGMSACFRWGLGAVASRFTPWRGVAVGGRRKGAAAWDSRGKRPPRRFGRWRVNPGGLTHGLNTEPTAEMDLSTSASGPRVARFALDEMRRDDDVGRLDVTTDCDGAGTPPNFSTRITAAERVRVPIKDDRHPRSQKRRGDSRHSRLAKWPNELLLTRGGHIAWANSRVPPQTAEP